MGETGEARERAFDELFRAAWPRAVMAARRILGPDADTEALAAEALTRAYDRWPRLCRHPAPEAWVLRVTINLAIDVARRARRSAAAAAPQGFGGAAAPRLALAAALQALPEKQRQAIALRYLADCEEATIAGALGIRPGTVKTHLKRGLSHLRDQLGPDTEKHHDLIPELG